MINSPINLKGKVTVTAINDVTDEVVQRVSVSNTIVRTGRVAITKLITGAAAQDRAYVVLDAPFPITYKQSPDISVSWLGLYVDQQPYLYYLGPLYSTNTVTNAALGPVTRDAYGLATYLNQLFSLYSSTDTPSDGIPIYQADGTIGSYFPNTPWLTATVVVIDGIQRVKISHKDSNGSIAPYSSIPTFGDVIPPAQMYIRFYTDDSLFGPNTIVHAASQVPTNASDYVVDGIQLSVSNGVTNIMDAGFVPGTYVSPRYVPVVSYGQSDAQQAYDTQAIFTAVIPAAEGNGENGLGVVYTEAALLCRDNSWFAHVNFGQFYKSDQIRLTIQWTVDCLPQ